MFRNSLKGTHTQKEVNPDQVKQTEFTIKAKRTGQEKLPNIQYDMTSVRCKRQSTSKEAIMQANSAQSKSLKPTQPIPSISVKAPGTMVAVTMGSISTPDDSSVRKVELTIASNITLPRLPLF